MSGSQDDVLIRGGTIVDGTGSARFRGDIVLSGDRVAAITEPNHVADTPGCEVIDASGMVVCPGFIDIQSHSIVPLMIDGRSLSKITQGVTTEIMGEGWTPAPRGGLIDRTIPEEVFPVRDERWEGRIEKWRRFSDWLDAMADYGVSPNIGSFLGGGTVRQYAMGMALGEPSPDALETMRRVTAESMEDGAFGVSYALIYAPDAYASLDELVQVCEVVGRYGGIYITHIRSEADRLIEAVEEALTIGRRAALPVEIYHLKAIGEENWSKIPAVLEMIEAARTSGQDVSADMYPYAASGTGLSMLFPPWLSAEGKFFDNLRDHAIRDRLRRDLSRPSAEWEAMGRYCGPERVMPVEMRKPENQQYVGMTLAAIAEMRGQDWIDAAVDLLLSEEQRIFTIYFGMSEENVRRQLRVPWISIASDAGGLDPDWAKQHGPTHPRAYGSFPRVLGRYVRDEGLLSLEVAIHKMTSLVARRIGLHDRGLLHPGAYADVVVFDPNTILDRATYDAPHQISSGVRDVWVNGIRVLANSTHTGATPGRFVRGPGAA